jgi:3-methyladenine DNA glycosylase AlkD
MPGSDILILLKQRDAWLGQLEPINTPSVRRVRRSFSRLLAKADPSLVLTVADALVKRGDWVDRLIAYETVAGHRAAFAVLDAKRVVRWSAGLDSWGLVDLFGCTLGGQAWREGILSDAIIEGWSRSPDRWRLALVCTVPLNSRARGGEGDASRTLRVCEALVADRDDMVAKALSWALRELGKRNPDAVRGFLARHQDRLASRVQREVMSKLTTGKKNVRRTEPTAASSRIEGLRLKKKS